MPDITTIIELAQANIELAQARLELCDKPLTVFTDHVLVNKQGGYLTEVKGGYNHSGSAVSCKQVFHKDGLKFIKENPDYTLVYIKDVLPEAITRWESMINVFSM